MENKQSLLRGIPAMDQLLRNPSIHSHLGPEGKSYIVKQLTSILNEIRDFILSSNPGDEDKIQQLLTNIPALLKKRLHSISKAHLQRIVNATGVIIHTNLGRAPLAQEAIQSVSSILGAYSNLEYSLDDGNRRSRDGLILPEVCRILGCEDATIVNNAAAALFLTMAEISPAKEVIVSRGELVEIGGSFRLPEIMKWSGAILREVGTTNKTYLSDYEKAISPATGMLLKVHSGNFRMLGFTHSATIKELAPLALRHNLPLVEDSGSGLLLCLPTGPLSTEPCPARSLAEGCDLVIFSGDKLLGGPQAGIIAGKSRWLQRLRANPLMRIIRPDKMTLAAMESTLKLYSRGFAESRIPVLQMIFADPASLKKRAGLLRKQLLQASLPEWQFEVVKMDSVIGGGSFPGNLLPSYGLRIHSRSCSANALEHQLRHFSLPIITRIERDYVMIDVRTLLKGDEKHIIAFFASRNPSDPEAADD